MAYHTMAYHWLFTQCHVTQCHMQSFAGVRQRVGRQRRTASCLPVAVMLEDVTSLKATAIVFSWTSVFVVVAGITTLSMLLFCPLATTPVTETSRVTAAVLKSACWVTLLMVHVTSPFTPKGVAGGKGVHVPILVSDAPDIPPTWTRTLPVFRSTSASVQITVLPTVTANLKLHTETFVTTLQVNV